MMTSKIAVFESEEELTEVLPLPSGVLIGEPAIADDGRVAICHPFTDEDLAHLQAGTEKLVKSGKGDATRKMVAKAEIKEKLPSDWKHHEEKEIIIDDPVGRS